MNKHWIKIVAAFSLLPWLMLVGAAQGSGMMGSGSPLPSMPGYQGHELDENMVIPQLAVGQHYTTSLLLFNMGNMSQMPWMTPQTLQVAGTIYFYGQDGTPLPVSINGGAAVSMYTFSLGPSKSASLELTSSAPDTSGWALIDVDDNSANSWGMMNGQQMMRANRIMATAYYTYKDGGQVISRAGVIPSTYEMQRYFTSITPVNVQAGINTGLALVNTSAQAITVGITLIDDTGGTVAIRQLLLPPGNQIARFVNEPQLFGDSVNGDFRGYVRVDTSSEGVVTMGMMLTGGILTSIPTQHYGMVSMMSR